MIVREIYDKELKQEISLGILNSLPQWFGIPEAVTEYAEQARDMPFFTAYIDDCPVGYIAIKLHNSYSAEVYVMGVLSQYHRQGIGKALIDVCCEQCRKNNYEYLQVKTLDEANPDEGYAKTRAFYLSAGFRPLECFPTLWDEDNPCLVMVMKI